MPSRNIIRYDVDDAYYHVYVRGLNKMPIFADAIDKAYFMNLISRHLSQERYVGTKGYVYAHYRGDVELLAFCVMDNHFHLLLYQIEAGSMSKLLKSLMVSYCAYYNRKYGHRGSIFESRYKASRISDDIYLQHISRYIHLNPRSWRRYKYSSYKMIVDQEEPEWLQPERILELFNDRKKYRKFVEDYENRKKELNKIKSELANL